MTYIALTGSPHVPRWWALSISCHCLTIWSTAVPDRSGTAVSQPAAHRDRCYVSGSEDCSLWLKWGCSLLVFKLCFSHELLIGEVWICEYLSNFTELSESAKASADTVQMLCWADIQWEALMSNVMTTVLTSHYEVWDICNCYLG